MPEGYIVGFEDKNPRQKMTEMAPRGQSVKDWTHMVTVQQPWPGWSKAEIRDGTA